MLTTLSNPDCMRLDQAALPERVRELLLHALDAARHQLTPLLRDSLLDVYRGQWQGAHGPLPASDATDPLPHRMQQQHAQAARGIEPSFLQLLESGLARLRQPSPAATVVAATAPSGPLQLVSLDAPDADTLIQDQAIRMATRAALPLHQLGLRMGVLAASAPVDAACNPLGPHRILACCRHACAAADLDEAQTIALLQGMEKRLLPVCIDVINRINTALRDGGLLVHVGVVHYRAASSMPAWTTAPAAAVAPKQAEPAAMPTEAAAARLEHRPAHARLDQALARLQQRDGQVPVSGAEIRQLLTAPGFAADAGPGPAADGDAHATFDMMQALFDALDDADTPGATRGIRLQPLHIPLLRAALDDPAMPEHAQHPAQRLLATLLQARHDWNDPADGDQSAALAIQDALTQARDGYQGDARVFERIDGELRQRLHTLSRRAQLTERRHVEAARGQERLAIARLHVEELLAQLTADLLLPPLFRALLEQSWQDVLVLTRLRHAPDAPRWLEQAALTRRLVDRQSRPQAEDDPELRTVVELALADIGYAESDAAGIALQLVPPPDTVPDPAEIELIARHLRNHHPAQPPAVSKGAPSTAARPPRSSEEEHWHDRLRQVPFGVWLEWQDEASSQWLRRRLAWFGTVTDRALIVNAHGHKVMDTTLDEMARRLAAGTLKLASSEPTAPRLLERAWQAARRSLGMSTRRTPAAASDPPP